MATDDRLGANLEIQMDHTLQVEGTFHSQRDAAPVHHSIVHSHSKERERRKQTRRRSQYLYTGLATVFSAEHPTQHTVLELSALDQCHIVTVNSEIVVVVVVVTTL